MCVLTLKAGQSRIYSEHIINLYVNEKELSLTSEQDHRHSLFQVVEPDLLIHQL